MKKANKKTVKKANRKTIKVYGANKKTGTSGKTKLQLITARARELKAGGMPYREAQKQAARELKGK